MQNKKQKAKKKSVIYILGFARSGSTILNILLGNVARVFSAGEINRYVSSGWLADEFCSCGSRVSECEFWPRVQRDLSSQSSIDPREIAETTKNLENWRNVLVRRRARKAESAIANHNTFYNQFFESIFSNSNSSYVVDASKDPIRLHFLVNSPKFHYHVLHIVRDPRAVCWSKYKSIKRNPEIGVERDLGSIPMWVTLKSLYMNAFLTYLVKRKLPKAQRLRINYEDLILHTDETFDTLGTFLSLDFSSVSERVAQDLGLEQQHNVAGNRLRMQKKIRLSYDSSWMREMSSLQFYSTTLLSLPLLLIYNYRLFPEVKSS